MTGPLMHIAMTKFSLIQGASATRSLLQELAEVTGIPTGALLAAEHRMSVLQQMTPLRDLFADPTVPKADKLRYKFGVKRVMKAPNDRRLDMCRLILDVESARGRLQISVDMVLKERADDKQTARLSFKYRLLRGNVLKTFRQSMTISSPLPGLAPRGDTTRILTAA